MKFARALAAASRGALVAAARQCRVIGRGALLMYSCLPVSEFGGAWPDGVSVPMHGKAGDPFFAEDLEAAQALVDSTEEAELFLYSGEEHLFADSSLPAYDATAATLLMERVLGFLDSVQAENRDLNSWSRRRDELVSER